MFFIDAFGSESVMQSVQFDAEVFQSASDLESAAPVFDSGHLQRYTLGDRNLQTEVLGLFREQIASSLVALNEAVASNDTAAWRMAAHTLKGSAWAVGAFRLAEAAEMAERSSASRVARSAAIDRVARDAVETVAAIS